MLQGHKEAVRVTQEGKSCWISLLLTTLWRATYCIRDQLNLFCIHMRGQDHTKLLLRAALNQCSGGTWCECIKQEGEYQPEADCKQVTTAKGYNPIRS